MFLGKEIRMKRLVGRSGRLLAITIDHPITRGLLPGLEDIRTTMKKVVEGGPDAITMHKGIAERIFPAYAGRAAVIMKATAYSVQYHPTYDAPVADVEEAIRLGADAISVGCIVGGPDQAQQLTFLGKVSKEAASVGMPLVAHIYPKGNLIKDHHDAKAVTYAARVGAELGVDIIKTLWTGSAESFREVVEGCPSMVALAGGEMGETLADYLKMTREALDVGLGGVTYGRFVWQHQHPSAVIKALSALIHDNVSVEQALGVYDAAVASESV
ncbi:MAG: class I fructose-bisphosphate aldolase [Burkholderiaceae bacterium]|jgi:class I fructose-bisphosphate aldolase